MVIVSRNELIKAPVIVHPLEPDEVENNGRKVLTVRFDGYPLPEIKWYHNNLEIQQSNNILINHFKNESTLVIVQCTPDMAGKYEARAMNEGGEARSSASLRIKGRELRHTSGLINFNFRLILQNNELFKLYPSSISF